MCPAIETSGLGIFERQAPATLNQATPVQNTYYTILDTTKNARIYQIAINIEDVGETLQVKVTIDGQTIESDAVSVAHSTIIYVHSYPDAINRTEKMTLKSAIGDFTARPFEFEGKSVKIEVKKTTANGAGNLTGIVSYGVLKNA